MTLKFTETGHGNFICRLSDDVFLSYNPDVLAEPLCVRFQDFAAALGIDANESSEETALECKSLWYILEGDHRKGIQKAHKEDGIPGVLKYFLKKHVGHTWSNGENDELEKAIADLLPS